jgi:hypothetical protein
LIITPHRTKVRICRWCGYYFIPIKSNQQYCKNSHSKSARQEQNRNHRRTHYHKYKEIRVEFPLGMSGLGPKPCDDIEEEKTKILREKKRIGL